MIIKIEKSWSEGIKKKNPKCLALNTSAVVQIKLSEPVCLELILNYSNLGRVIIRDNDKTIASGTVIQLLH